MGRMRRNIYLIVKSCMCILFSAGLSHNVFSQVQVAQFGAPAPVYRELTVYRTDSAPKIDGDLSDGVWQKLPRITGFTDISFKHTYVVNQTLFSICYDEKNIYLAVDCRERFPDKIKATLKERDSGIAIDDSIEVFFDMDLTGKRYIQIMVNAIGTQFDYQAGNPKWSGEWKSAVKRTPKGWLAEFSVPWTTLGVSMPKPGEKWRGNINRNRYAGGDTYSSWSVLMSGSFHSPGEFGYWIFANPGEKPDRNDETKINKEFLSFFRSASENIARKGGHKISQIERIPAGERPGWIKESAGIIETLSKKLRSQIANAANMDDWLECYSTGAELNNHIAGLAGMFSSLGPGGRIELPAGMESGIRKTGSYWFLISPDSIFTLDSKTGCIAGIWERQNNQRQVSISYDLYTLETMSETLSSDELTDEVKNIENKKSVIVFTCANPDFPGLKITKEYLLEGRMLIKRVSVSSKVKEKTLFTASSNTIFDKDYRSSSYYNRVLPCGASGGADPRATIPAESVTSEMVQRAGFNSPSGWAHFLLINNKTWTGLAQYLYKINDEYVWIPYSVNSSYWNPNGWEMSFMATFLEEKPFTSEMRYHIFQGDQLSFYQEYLSLPDTRAVRNDIKVSPLISKMRYESVGDGVMHALNSNFANMPRFAVPYNRLRSDEVNIAYYMPSHSIFSYWPSKDSDSLIVDMPVPYDTYNKTTPVADIKKATGIVKNIFPRFLINGFYWWCIDIHPKSELFQKHPEFLVVGKDGKQLPALSYTSFGSYQADMSRQFIDAVVPEYEKMFKYLNQDFIYFDNGGGMAVPDWGDGRVVQATDYIRFFKTLREMMEKDGKFIFVNADTGHLYVDLAYAEAVPTTPKQAEDNLGKEWWRVLNERMMQYKFFEREGSATILLFWQDYRNPDGTKDPERNNAREYTNLLLSLGMRPHTCYYDYHVELKTEPGKGTSGDDVDWSAMYNYEEAYHQATLEMHGTRIVDPALEPAYWRDFETKIEAYALRLGDGFFFTANNHYDEPRDVILSADIRKMDMTTERRAFLWNYTRRDDTKVNRLDGLGNNPDWDRLFTKIECQNRMLSSKDGRLQIEMPNLEPNLTKLSTVTQVPGFIYSVEGQRTQFLLPETLGCKIDGSLNETKKTNMLNVNADKPLEVIAWWPEEWGNARIEIVSGGAKKILQKEEISKITYGNEWFLIIGLPKGETGLKILKDG